MPVTGQLWFVTEGGFDNLPPSGDNFSDARIVYVNDDGLNQTVFADNNPTTDLITGSVTEIGLDTAAGWFFAIVNGGNLGTNARLVRGEIDNPGPVTVVAEFTFGIGDPVDPGDDDLDDIIVNALHVDNINEKIYVTYQDQIGDAANTGIRQFTYNPLTGAVTDDGFLVQASVDTTKPIDVDHSVDLLNARDFELDLTSNTLYFTELLTGGIEEMGLYRMDLTTKVITQMVSSAALPGGFPDDGINGYIIDVEVDPTTDKVYFSTQSQAPGGNALHNQIWTVAQNATEATATPVVLTGTPAGFYPGDMVFDQNLRRLYVESEGNGAIDTDDAIYVFQLDVSGNAASLVGTIDTLPEFTGVANLQGMAFDILAEIGTLSGTSTVAVEQVTQLDLLTAAPTITDQDGDHLNNATVTISGSFVGSGDQLSVDGVTSGLIAGTNITATVTTNAGNQTLTLSGYDTFANYQTVLNNVEFLANGDNPTNYGDNTTRTITWQVNDGAAGNPSGTVNGTDTNVRTTTITLEAVNDAPVNTVPGAAPSANEDVLTALAGFSVSDVDADPASDLIVVTLSVNDGVIDLLTNVGGGITAGQVANNGTDTVTITATQNQINTTFGASGLRYQSDLNFNGTDTLTVTTNDQGATGTDPGSSGDGTSEQDSDQRTITVVAVNDTPTDIAVDGGGALSAGEFAADNTVIGQFVASDPDTGQSFTYSLQNNAGGRFAISAGGQLTVAAGLLLDFEQLTSHDITVRVTDQDNAFYDEPFTVNVNDVDPEVIDGDNNANTFVGGELGDTIAGGGDGDTISGGAGEDSLYGSVSVGSDAGDGGDTLNGGDDNDFLQGNGGEDTLHGDAGDDELRGGKDNDDLFGDAGEDLMFGGRGLDEMHGGDDNDTMYGNSATADPTAETDLMFGEGGDDFLQGNGGDDQLDGGIGEDELRGGKGNDQLFGDADDDILIGALGTDDLTGGTGDDRMTGGADGDTFFFADNDGSGDIVTDFQDGLDIFDLAATAITDFNQLVIGSSASGVSVDYLAGQFLISNITDTNLLTSADFNFV